MNVDELLRERGDQWQPPPVNEPDLDAALGRSARHNRVVRSLVAGVALLAVAGTTWALLPGGRGPVPAVPEQTASASPSPTRTVAVVPDPNVRPALIQVASSIKADFQKLPVSEKPDSDRIAVVGSTAGAAVSALAGPLQLPPDVDPATPVWVVQATGRFDCGPCAGSGDSGKGHPVLRALVDQATLDVVSAGPLDDPAGLDALGAVTNLTLVEDRALWRKTQKAVNAQLAQLEEAKVTHSVRASQTTLWRAQKRLFGRSSLPTSYKGVWVVRVSGEFTCSRCTRQSGSEHGTALAMVVDQWTGEVLEIALVKPSFDPFLKGRTFMIWTASLVP